MNQLDRILGVFQQHLFVDPTFWARSHRTTYTDSLDLRINGKYAVCGFWYQMIPEVSNLIYHLAIMTNRSVIRWIDQFGIPSSREVSFCQNRAHRSFWTPDLGEISAISSSLFIVWTQFTRDRNDRWLVLERESMRFLRYRSGLLNPGGRAPQRPTPFP